MLNRMVPTPTRIFTIRGVVGKTILYFFFKILDFFQKPSKKSGKKKNQGRVLYPLGSTFNAESNGTNPSLVSLLYVE